MTRKCFTHDSQMHEAKSVSCPMTVLTVSLLSMRRHAMLPALQSSDLPCTLIKYTLGPVYSKVLALKCGSCM